MLLIRKDLLELKNRNRSAIFWVLLLLAVCFLAAVYFMTLEGFRYIKTVEEVTEAFICRIYSLVLILFFPLTFISSCFISFYTLTDSADQLIIFKAPVSKGVFFYYLILRNTVKSSLFPVLILFTSFFSLAKVLGLGCWFPYCSLLGILPFFLIINLLSALCMLALFNLMNVARFREILVATLLFLSILLIVLLRLTQPENLVDLNAQKEFIEVVNSMKTPVAPYLPSSWVSQLLLSLINQDGKNLVSNFSYLYFSVFLLSIAAFLAGDKKYFKGWLKYSREARERLTLASYPYYSENKIMLMMEKDWKLLLRDKIQLSQVVLIGALIIIYIFNMYKIKERIPDSVTELWVVLFNIGFASMIVASLCSRFSYTCFGLEGRNIAWIRTSPLSTARYLSTKFIYFLVPFMLLSQVLVIGGLYFIRGGIEVLLFSSLNSFFQTVAIVSLSLGFGARFADYSSTSPEEKAFSAGGILYMVSAFFLSFLTLLLQAPILFRICLPGFSHYHHHHLPVFWVYPMITLLYICAIAFPLWAANRTLKDLRL
ncbi:MAG: hypothetical protein PHW04_04880 [Candidatus Wallbacteria bacterium]|nr:hypothetical protein [Candidatus Wallbacteria bacterium]